jgi:urease accessory protein
VVPGAQIKASSTSLAVERTATSDEDGFYRIAALPAGIYTVTVSGSGFANSAFQSVELTVNRTITLDAQLEVGSVTGQINVTAEAVLIDPTTPATGTTVTPRQIRDMPVNGRNFLDFATLTPGVVRDPTRAGDLAVGGQKGTLNSLQVDGADNNNTFFGQSFGRTGTRPPYQFSEESVQEFQVNQNGFSAEFGRAGGAVINVVTKSGTNQWHGSAFEYFRDESLNSNTPILTARPAKRPKSQINQFGGTLGGAIYAGAVGTLVPHVDEIALLGTLAIAVAPPALLAATNPRFSAAPFSAVMVFFAPTITHAGPIASAVERVTEVAVGAVVGLVVSFLVLPARAHELMIEAAGRMLARIAQALPQLCGGFSAGLDEAAIHRIQEPLGDALARAKISGVLYEDVNDPRGIGLLTFSEDPDFFLDRVRPDLATLYLQSASGGLYAADRLTLDLVVGAGAALHLTTQGSTIVHDGRADGSTMRQSVTVKDQAFCAMISDPYVLFPGADLHLATTATVAANAILIMADGFAVHDPHRRGGTFARFSNRTRVMRPDGELLVSDRGSVGGDELAADCGALGGMAAAASALMIAPPDQLPEIAAIEAAVDSCGCIAGATSAPNGAGISMRLLAPDGGTLIRGIEAAFHVGARAALGVDLAPRRK